MNRILLAALLCLLCPHSEAQRTLNHQGNRWSLTAYGNKILKITCRPDGYVRNENITDAVILKPVSQNLNARLIAEEGGGVTLTGISRMLKIFPVNDEKEFRGFRFKLSPGEKIFGGGSRALPLDRRGYSFSLYNNPWYGYEDGADNLNFSVPFFLSSEGYALFFDNASKGYADIGKTLPDYFDAGFSGGELNVFVIFGKDYRELISNFSLLTGKQPMPPRWALGNFMSRFGYTGEKQMNTIAQKMAEQHIPVDAIVFDLFWFGDSIKGTLGNLNWENRIQWPNPQKMLQQLRQSSIRPILITEPFFLKGTRNYEEAKRYLATDSAGNPFTLQDFYFGKGGILDIFRKDAGDWIWNIHYKKQIANGTAGWWTDLAEPEKHPQGIRHNLSALGFNRKFGADEVHNAFSHYWSKMLYDKYAVHHPDIRLFHLTRSGFAGSQRYSIFPWSGDVSRSWKGLQAQLKIMQGMSLSGIPYMHADAGGFAGGNGDKELYVRWLQFAAFTPIFRPHGTALGDVDPNAFDFPSEPALIDTPYNRTARSVIDLRYRMLPYNYTLSYQQTKEGTPLTAPLFYHFPQDSVCYRATDQFMWGSSILVAPVTEKGMSNRKVYLPEGYWYRLNNQFSISGVAPEKGWVDCALTGEEIPFFAKAGSIIPTRKLPEGSNTARYSTDTLVIHYFPDDKPSDYVLYDDDGESRNALKKGNYQLIRFRANPEVGGKTRIRVSAGNGSFNGKPRKRLMYFIVHGTGNSNDKTDSEKNYSGSIVFTGNPQQIVVQ